MIRVKGRTYGPKYGSCGSLAGTPQFTARLKDRSRSMFKSNCDRIVAAQRERGTMTMAELSRALDATLTRRHMLALTRLGRVEACAQNGKRRVRYRLTPAASYSRGADDE